MTHCEIEERLGMKINDTQFEEALSSARYKLAWIIAREGDLNGERLKDWYLAELVAERIRVDNS